MDLPAARLSESARAALRLADEEALGRNHDYTGQEHLLLGLVGVPEGAAVAVLRALNVSPEEVRTELDLTIGRRAIAATRRPRTAHLERALELAADEASGFQHPAVGSDHLLLGLLREGQGAGAEVLKGRGVTLNAARDQTLRLRAAGQEEP